MCQIYRQYVYLLSLHIDQFWHEIEKKKEEKQQNIEIAMKMNVWTWMIVAIIS